MSDRKKVFRGDRLRRLRELAGKTQDSVEEEMKLGNTAIYRYEKGDAEPTSLILTQLAEYFNCTTDYLLGLTNEPYKSTSEDSLAPDELKLLAAYRRRDLKRMMQLAITESDNQAS